MDEIDSLLSKRQDGENDALKTTKTEFLIQTEGVSSNKDTYRVLLIGATNRQFDLDLAILRRLRRELYVARSKSN